MREGGKEPREGEGRGGREGADNAGGLAPSKAYAAGGWLSKPRCSSSNLRDLQGRVVVILPL